MESLIIFNTLLIYKNSCHVIPSNVSIEETLENPEIRWICKIIGFKKSVSQEAGAENDQQVYTHTSTTLMFLIFI
jgi:hypothetical protein